MHVTFPKLGRRGRLGNQLFQIASTIGIARRNSCDYFLPRWRYAEYLEWHAPQEECGRLPGIFIEETFRYQEVAITQSTALFGFFQSEQYFRHCEKEVRAMFRLKADLWQYLQSKYRAVLAGPTCSLHVRRGDYARCPRFVQLWNTDYYDRALSRFSKDTRFLVFSDDLDWCRSRFRGEQFVFIDGEPDILDLFLMTLCDDHIIANSTFSWWGAWLDTKPTRGVLAPRTWFAAEYANPYRSYRDRRGRVCGYHDTADLLPIGWNIL